MKTRKSFAVAALVVLVTSAVWAAENDPVTIPDAALRAVVQQALGITDGRDPTQGEMATLTVINARNLGVADLTGIEYATNLEVATFYGGQISNLTPLSGLTKLRELNLWRNQISNLQPLSGLTNLTLLEMAYNQISDLSPLSGLTNLEVLMLGGANQISDLTPLSRLTSLRELFMDHNQISNLTPLSGLVNLRTLVLHVNQISDLTSLSGLSNLIELGLHVNQISDLGPLSRLTNLQVLTAGLNQISNLTPLSALTNLTALELMTNQISDLTPLLALTNLTVLKLGSNQISDISALSGLEDLGLVRLERNLISDISPLTALTHLYELWLTNNPLNSAAYDTYIPLIQANNPGARIWYDPYSPPVYFADANLKQAVKDALGIAFDPTQAKMATLSQLSAISKGIADLTGIEYAVNLTYLNLRDNQINNLSLLSGLTRLTDLRLLYNVISDLSPLSGMANLRILRLQSNQISDVSPLSALMNLDQLWLTSNPLDWDSHFVCIPMIKANNSGIDLQYDPWVETDSDGVSAEVENGAPNGGDGNDDGIPDGLQDEVASVPNAVDTGYVTLESPGGTDLVSVSATANPSTGSLPEGVDFPIGFFEFAVPNLTPGEAITVTIFTSAEISTYYKYGPTADDPMDHWYEFLYDGATGAEILADRVILHLVDGQRGDDDLTANGEIVEPGGPGLVLNTPPLAMIAAPSSGFVASVGTAVDFAGTILDPDADDTHTATWTIGGVEHTGTVSGSSATASIQFSQAGVYSVSLGVTDASGARATADTVNGMPAYVVIYDPEGGFVTGGGWIDSPAGAYVPDSSLTGKANFGFVSKYQKGAMVPTGQTEFVFQTADLNFHSSDYEWLVVTGSDYARFKGTGTIRGFPQAYKFMIWARDADADKFRIKIWYEEDEVELFTVYDNGMEQPIGGGSIIVHTQ